MPKEQQRNDKKFFSLSSEERQELEADAVKSKEKKMWRIKYLIT